MASGDWAYRLVRWSLAGVFLAAGGDKLLRPEALALIIGDYGLLPEIWVAPVSIALPVVEIVAGAGLIFDARGSLSMITGLLILFAAVLGYGIWLGLDTDCGCFGPGDLEADVYHGLRPALYRDLVMIAGVAFLHYWRRRRSTAPAAPAVYRSTRGIKIRAGRFR
jgi:hypothetical protein